MKSMRMDTSAFLHNLHPSDLVLTANSRLTRSLQQSYREFHQKINSVFEAPRILPLTAWLEQQFYTTNLDGLTLLSDFQEQCVWEDIILNDPSKPVLLQPVQTAILAKEAFARLTQWQVPISELTPFTEQIEVENLLKWIAEFHSRLKARRWLCGAQLPQHLLLKDQKTPLSMPGKIILLGFDDHSPALQAFFFQLQKRIRFEITQLSAPQSEQKRFILESTACEITSMARWAKAKLQKNPNTHIGCVIPDLGDRRTEVHRIFTRVFSRTDQPLFNISAGRSLLHYPMIQHAITMLAWCEKPIAIEQLSALLQSPYLCRTESEANMGAQMDILLRETHQTHSAIHDLFSETRKLQTVYPENTWFSRLRAFSQTYQEIAVQKQAVSAWVKHFLQLLKMLHWPSEHTQNSVEFQLLERFKKLCQECSGLDFIFPEISITNALYLLKTLAKKTIFQAQSHNEPIQIMGVLEASGIAFDATWVMGLHDGAWPAASRPHPFIPYAIQQQYQMPHATAKRELQFCEQMTKRLENSAAEVIFSSPAFAGDQPLFPARLILATPLIQSEQLDLSEENDLSLLVFNSRQTESFEDNHGSAVKAFSDIHGGSKILKLQAECPFRAYAEIRLKAKSLNTPSIDIPPTIKGILIHHILFELWGELGDQKTLLSLSDEKLTQHIETVITKTFESKLAQNFLLSRAHFLAVEKKRLLVLIKNWLEFEKTRPPFRVVEREANCPITVAKLPLQLRMDRVDELNDGSRLLIDYKTSKNSLQKKWLQERLTDPQLPLYAAFQDHGTTAYAGISFAEVRTGNTQLNGVLHENHTYAEQAVSKLSPIHRTKNELSLSSWEGLMENWRRSLSKLSHDFSNGVATPNPVEKKLCKVCDVRSLCRHANFLTESDESDDELCE